MENKNSSTSETIQKILKGLDLVAKKLIESKKRNEGELVIFKDGEIKVIKAVDIVE